MASGPKISLIIILLSIFTINVNATTTRVNGFNGAVYVPDKETDTIFINPAFLSKYNNLIIYNSHSAG